VVKVGDFFVRVLHLSGLRISKLLFTKRDPKVRSDVPVSQVTSVAELRDKLKARRQRLRELSESGSRQGPRSMRPRKEAVGQDRPIAEPGEAGDPGEAGTSVTSIEETEEEI
jgi:hypothetical protein